MTENINKAGLQSQADIRLCQICLWNNYDGFGFRMKKNSDGPHIVNMVESNSPASIGGLQIGDLILSVNQNDVYRKEYDKVHKIIKTACDTKPYVELLVIAQTDCQTLKHTDIFNNSSLWTVITTPTTMPADFSDFPRLIPRICHLCLDRKNKQFGFHIIIGDNNVGAYIQTVYDNSPASDAGLRKCDRIIEINDRNVDLHSGEYILKKLDKAYKKGVVKLFVADTHTYQYYMENKIKFDSNNTKKAVSSSKSQKSRNFNHSQNTNHQVLSKRDDNIALSPKNVHLTATRQNIAKNESKDERYSSIQMINQERKHTIGRRLSKLFSSFKQSNKSENDDKAVNTGENDQEVISNSAGNSNNNDFLSEYKDSYNRTSSIYSLNIDGDTRSKYENRNNDFRSPPLPATNVRGLSNSSKLERNTIRDEYPADSDDDQTSRYKFSSNSDTDSSLSSHEDEDESNKYFSSHDNATIDRYSRCASFDSQKKPIQSKYQSSATVTLGVKYADTRNLFVSHIPSSTLKSCSMTDLNRSDAVTYKINPAVTDSVVSATNGTIQVCYGDITKQTVDAIVIASTSDRLRKTVLREVGDSIRTAYDTLYQQQKDSSIYTNGGNLSCKRIYFIPCPKLSRNASKWVFRKFVTEAIRMAINDPISKVQSIAFPAIGCGQYGCNSNFVAKTLILAVAYELEQQPSLQLNVSFVIQRQQQTIFDVFQKELMAFKNNRPVFRFTQSITLSRPLPPKVSNYEAIKRQPYVLEKRLLNKSSHEYNAALKEFTATMTTSLYKEIVRIELVWNECWYKQYEIHKGAFFQRLKSDTEKLLFHGCSEDSANSIMKNCFNRSYAGKNGVAYGYGVYFSSRACYSHSYTSPNSRGERCMFLAKVLIGNTIKGNSGMKVCPIGYDSTTDGSHIYVIYHDAQAFGKYLITYK